MKTVDLIIQPEWLIPVAPAGAVYKDCALVVHEGLIEAVLPAEAALKDYQPVETVHLAGQALLPGLINAHCHSAMTLLRGFADDLPLDTWLQDHIWPAESQWVSDDFVRDGTRNACAEMIRSGITCFSDMYFFPEMAAEVATKAGLRARITFPVLEFPSAWAQGPDEYLHKGLALHDQYRNHSLISVAFGPHAPYTVSDKTFERVAVLSEELDAPIQLHLQETKKEVEDSLKEYGIRPVERMEKLGILGPRTEAVHMTQLTDDDLDSILKTNTSVVHCPKSNLKLASGFCPLGELTSAGVEVALGTDSAASNNCLNMIEEMRVASLLAKAVAEDATVLSAQQSLHMATLGGATAMGLDKEIGSLEAGKSADMMSIRLDNLQSQPLYDVISQIVYAAPTQAHNTWVRGKPLMRDGELLTLNENEIFARSQDWAKRISGT